MCVKVSHFCQTNSTEHAGNATRSCSEGGHWDRSNYTSCIPLNATALNDGSHSELEITSGIYFFGYCLSLGALIIAMFILIAFK